MDFEPQLTLVLERLEDAVRVCYEAPEIEDQGYPYATGYSRSAMMGAIEDIAQILRQMKVKSPN